MPARRSTAVSAADLGYAPVTAAEAYAPGMSESKLQGWVRDHCDKLSLGYYHVYYPEKSMPGWPDTVIYGPSGILFVELKDEDGELDPAQVDTLAALEIALAPIAAMTAALGIPYRAEVVVRRPRDIYNGVLAADFESLTRTVNEPGIASTFRCHIRRLFDVHTQTAGARAKKNTGRRRIIR